MIIDTKIDTEIFGTKIGFFDCHGGVSDKPYRSLNIGYGLGDKDENIAVNRNLVKTALGFKAILSAKQVHGDRVYCLQDSLVEDLEVDGFDALVTNLKNVGLLIQQADCQAVLLCDPEKQVVAAIHCGWRGNVMGIIPKTIKAMIDNYGSIAKDIKAYISPSLGPCCAEFINYKRELPAQFSSFKIGENHFDFWQISTMQLQGAGIVEKNIAITEVCTSCSPDFFSYRRAVREGNGITGRNCSVIGNL